MQTAQLLQQAKVTLTRNYKKVGVCNFIVWKLQHSIAFLFSDSKLGDFKTFFRENAEF